MTLKNMTPHNSIGNYTIVNQTYFDGMSRDLYVTDIETPYPEGRLIVSYTDIAGIIRHANQAFIDLSGYTKEELIGQPHSILRHPDVPPFIFEEMWTTIQAGKIWYGYVKNLRKDGGYYWVYATVVPTIKAGKIVAYTSVRRMPNREKVEAVEAIINKYKASN